MSKIQGRSTWNKFGYNEDIDTGSEEIIASFGGTFNIMTTDDRLSIVSSSTNDSSAGTGANSIAIIGIDQDYNSVTEYITLNGTTSVRSVNSFLGVNRAYVISSGSSTVPNSLTH